MDSSPSHLLSHSKLQINKFHDDYIAELYHGPSLSENDFAMQFLGNYLEYYVNKHLKQKNDQVHLFHSTSWISSPRSSPSSLAVSLPLVQSSTPFLISRSCLFASSTVQIGAHLLFCSLQFVWRAKGGRKGNVKGHGHLCPLHPRDCIPSPPFSRIVEFLYLWDLIGDCGDDQEQAFPELSVFGLCQRPELVPYLAWDSVHFLFSVLISRFYFYTSLHLYKQGIRDIALSTNSANMTSMMAGILARDMGCPMSHLLISCDRKDPIQSLFQTGRFDFLEYKTSPVCFSVFRWWIEH